MKLAGAIGGGIAARKAAREQSKRLDQQMQENQDWYDRRYNEDATQRADAQRLLTMTEEAIKNRNRQAASAAAVMGGTTESVAAQKAANNAALADTVSQIAADAASRKDAIEGQYMANKSNIVAQQNAVSNARAKAITDQMANVSNIAGDIAEMFDKDGMSKK
jgi:hypothetical protein